MNGKKYNYHVEDGQFSFDAELDKLLGIEGNVIKLSPFGSKDSEIEVYILYIEDTHVECIGSIENSFPKTPNQHIDWKKTVIEAYKEYD